MACTVASIRSGRAGPAPAPGQVPAPAGTAGREDRRDLSAADFLHGLAGARFFPGNGPGAAGVRAMRLEILQAVVGARDLGVPAGRGATP
jgi:hypothetical protein